MVYPPCDTTALISEISLHRQRENQVISFAQFRPEKNHPLQLRVWKSVLSDPRVPQDSKFLMIGTVRGEEDQKIVDDLRTMAKDLKIERNVEFKINQPRDVLFEEF